ncbi:MAG: DHH family phosphoesterase [Candidatus Micrarchaeales archaeon]
MKLYNVTHSSDLDGMASAALLVHYYDMPLDHVRFINYGGKIFDDCTDFIASIKGTGNLLVVSDFGMVDNIIGKMEKALISFKKKGNKIIWLDHHLWSKSAIERLGKVCDFMIVGENKDYCGTELVYRFLCDKDKFGDRLAKITHLADFALESESKEENHLIDKIAYGIKYLRSDDIANRDLLDFVSCLAKGDIDCEIINNAYNKYMKESRPYLEKLLKSAKIIEVNGVKIAVGFGTHVSHQEACMTMLKTLKTDISIHIGAEKGNSSIRSIRDPKSWGVDSVGIANAFLGGGHPLASGFSLEKSGYDLTDKTSQKEIIEKIRKVSVKLYGKKVKYFQQSTGKYSMR